MSETLQITYRKPSELSPLDTNPRRISDKDLEVLAKSIKDNPDFFEARPLILSDRTGNLVIVAGCQRFRAAKSLKLKKVPTILLSGLTEAREREITIRDNVSNGAWDFDILKESWMDLPLTDWGANVPDLSDIDLDKFFTDDLTKPVEESFSIVLNYSTSEECEDVKATLIKHGETFEAALNKLLKR